MQLVKIIFEDLCLNVKKFKIMGLGPEITDTVRLDDMSTSNPQSREALSSYNFWFDKLSKLIKTYQIDDMKIICNDILLLREYHKKYCDQSLINSPWPFKY